MECEFMGSAGTLLSAAALKSLAFVKPLAQTQIQNLSIYENPIPKHNYVCVVDTSRGKGLDYSAFAMIDVSEIPYKLVATYRDNDISHWCIQQSSRNFATTIMAHSL
jgi:hypothetical protein